MAGMTPTTTDTFPTVGDYDSVMNMSGQRSPYTMPVERHGAMNDNPPDSAAGGRSHTMIHEAHGPTFRPVATRVYGPTETPRAIRTVPSSVGNRDFWRARAMTYEGETL